MKRFDVVKKIMSHINDEIIVNCNGMIGREAFTVNDREANFYMLGSMGLASSIAVGVAVHKPNRKVIVFDGDGHVLMNMSTLATAVALDPKNYYHICIDNETYASTGDQETISKVVKLDEVAKATGYKKTYRCTTMDEVKKVVPEFLNSEGPVFLLIKVEPGNIEDIERVSHTPEEITKRFSKAVQS